MAKCCEDPTEAVKVDPRELRQQQQLYGNLLRDLFTSNPESILIQQLQNATPYLRELAALSGFYPSLRLKAIELLEQESLSVLEQLIAQQNPPEITHAAQQRLEFLQTPHHPVKDFFNRLK